MLNPESPSTFSLAPTEITLLVNPRFNIALFQANSLGPPWGKCGEGKMEFHNDSYTLHRCTRECETKAVLSKCNCREYYMPGYSKGSVTYSSLELPLKCTKEYCKYGFSNIYIYIQYIKGNPNVMPNSKK